MEKVLLDGIEPYAMPEPLYEGLRVLLSYRGEKITSGYMQGISGAAFRIAGICPCAPTCNYAVEPHDLAELLGYDVSYLPFHVKGTGHTERLRKIITNIKEELRANRPALLWHAFSFCEWDVVCGFDDNERIFLGRSSHKGKKQYTEAPEERSMESVTECSHLGAILVGEKLSGYDAEALETNSLHEAVSHAHSTINMDRLNEKDWVMLDGLMCYDRWVKSFKDPDKVPDQGDSYCISIYSKTHAAAGDYMHELASKQPSRLSKHYKNAGEHFYREGECLNSCVNLVGFNAARTKDSGRNKETVHLLQQARDSYFQGIKEIEIILGIIH